MADGERDGKEKAGAEGDAEGAEESGRAEGGSSFDDALEAGGDEGKGKAGGDAGGKKDTDPAWLSQVAEDLRPALKSFPKPTDLGRAYVAQTKALADLQASAKGMIKLPGKGAKEEDILSFKKSLGIPTKPEEYDFSDLKLPEGMEIPEDRDQYLRQFAAKAGLSNKQAKMVLMEIVENSKRSSEAMEKELFPDVNKLMEQVKEEWGPDYVANRTAFMRYFREFADDELRTLALTTPLGNNKAFIRSAVRVGKLVGESALHEGRSTPAKTEDDDDYDKSPELRRRR